jgi:DHA2 family multidrug resistance protein-like MFS transporter
MTQLGAWTTGGISHRWLAMGALTLALIAIGLDQTVLNLALPTLSASLHASESQLQWFVTAYTLALAAAMLPAGLLGDRYGRKTILVAAILLFGVMSIACAYAPDANSFIAARTLLGVAGATLLVMSLSVVTVLFSERERPRAMGIWAAGNFLALPLGPIVGGYVLAHFWWGWVFLMNVPVVIVGLVAVTLFVPQSRAERRPGIDILGVLLSSAGLAILMYGLVEAGDNGWGSSSAIGPSIVAVALLAAFVGWESWLTVCPDGQPLVDLGLFRSRSFSVGVVLAGAGIFGMFGVLFTLPQYLQAIMGVDAQGAGLRFLPTIAGLVIGAVPADRVAVRIGPKFTIAIGFAIMAAGMIAGSAMTVSTSDAYIAAFTFVVGAGAGLGLATAASAAIIELSAERSGVGGALVQAIVKLGPAFGATILGSVLNSTYQSHVSVAGLPAVAAAAVQQSVFGGLAVAGQIGSPALLESVRTAFVAGMDDASRVGAVIAVAAVVGALVFMPRRSSAATRMAAPSAAGASSEVAAVLPSSATLTGRARIRS